MKDVKCAEALCPGVYYVSALGENAPFAVEYYIAEKDTKCLSDEAKKYGNALSEHPELLVYRLDEYESGAAIVKYECQKYCISNNLPLPDKDDIFTTVVFGRENFSEYFGDFSEYTLKRGEKTEYDSTHGIDNTLGYLFFSEHAWALAIFELMQNCEELTKSELIDVQAHINAIWTRYPDYATTYNRLEGEGLNDSFGLRLRAIGFDKGLNGSVENMITLNPSVGTEYLIL